MSIRFRDRQDQRRTRRLSSGPERLHDAALLVGAGLFVAAGLLLAACRSISVPAPTSSERPARPQTVASDPTLAGDTLGLRLPTGVRLDPAGTSFALGSMPLSVAPAPGGRRAAVLLCGWREQGVQIVAPGTGRVLQTLEQPAAFLGLAFSPGDDLQVGGRALYASGGNQDVVYRYRWQAGRAALADSLVLAAKAPGAGGTRYPAGLALSPAGRALYVAENLADSLAVVDLASGAVVQRLPAGRYPYGVAVAPDGAVYVSAWGESAVHVYRPAPDGSASDGSATGRLVEAGQVAVARHPSALLLSADGRRLFVASASTDQVSVVDTRRGRRLTDLLDRAPTGPAEGSTPNALALSEEGTRLFVAEADNNAVAVFDLSAETSGVPGAQGNDLLAGRLPTEWYPAAVAAQGDTLLVANGKGQGTGPNAAHGPNFGMNDFEPRGYTLGQLSGTLSVLPAARASAGTLAAYTERVAVANRWTPSEDSPEAPYPPFEHVVYIIKENRTYDQVLGDLSEGDGDSSLVYFPRPVSPNHHALADRFGLYDRFFVNAEVSPDGHNWSMAAYATDYLEKTVPSNYSGRGRSYDYEGTNRGERPLGGGDVAAPANGYLWNLAQEEGLTFRNFGEFVAPEEVDDDEEMPTGYRGLKPYLEAHTEPDFPGFNMRIPDQKRADVWLQALRGYEQKGAMPALQIIRLPNDHTMGARPGAPTPSAYMADNDLALGRIVEALSRSPFWKNTVVFVVEDDAQNGPDHVDSHRAPFFVISPYNRPGVVRRFANTTDALATMEEILGLGSLSQFDHFGRPLRGVFAATPDLTPYEARTPEVSLDEENPAQGPGAKASERLDFRFEDVADEVVFNRVLWRAIKGRQPYPGVRRISTLELQRGN